MASPNGPLVVTKISSLSTSADEGLGTLSRLRNSQRASTRRG
ncbi:hypothetical protein PQR53_28530 [Paraburkholderia fungorum]